MIDEDFKQLIVNGDMKRLKYYFADCLDGDPTFKHYEDEYQYCIKNKILFEPYREIHPLRLNDIDEHYWVELKNDFMENPSIKRMEHMRKVAKILYAESIDRAEKEKKKREEEEAAYKRAKMKMEEKQQSELNDEVNTTPEQSPPTSDEKKPLNQYFLLDLSLKGGYSQHKPALKKLLKIIFPDLDESTIWDDKNRYNCTEVNNAIDKYFTRLFRKRTPDLCLDHFVELFGDGTGTFDSYQTSIKKAIHEVVNHKDVILKNINERCK